MLTKPENVPEKGLYYHYKHDPVGEVNNYAYRMVGVGLHTEEDGLWMVVYRPIYPSSVYTAGKFFDVRPLTMWMEDVTKDGKIFPRFKKITDPAVITELEKIEKEIYAE